MRRQLNGRTEGAFQKAWPEQETSGERPREKTVSDRRPDFDENLVVEKKACAAKTEHQNKRYKRQDRQPSFDEYAACNSNECCDHHRAGGRHQPPAEIHYKEDESRKQLVRGSNGE